MSEKERHKPVMLSEFLELFSDASIRFFFEGTLGAGGHAESLLAAHPEIEQYFACDQDPSAIEISKKRLEPWKDKIVFIRGNFRDLDQLLTEEMMGRIDGFFLI